MATMWLACHISLVAPGYVRSGGLGDLWRNGLLESKFDRPSCTVEVGQSTWTVHLLDWCKKQHLKILVFY